LIKPDGVLSKTLIWILAAIAVAVVLAFEAAKGLHHSVFVGPGKEIDYPATAFWGLDAIVAAIVTFVMVKVAFSFDRLEDILQQQRQRAETLSIKFEQTTVKLDQLRDQMQNVARTIVAGGGILKKLNSDELWKVLQANQGLEASYIENLDHLTGVWGDLILAEGRRQSVNIGARNLGLACWGVAIDTYLSEERLDIKNRTLATNIGLYIKLISSLVDKVLEEAKKENLNVDLLATAVLLPVEYYNWKEYKKDEEQYAKLSGTSLEFMDDYRRKMAEWLQNSNGLSLRRILLVKDENKIGDGLRLELNDLAIQSLEDLSKQSKLGILCDLKSGKPQPFRIADIGTFVQLDKGFPELHKEEYAYAIFRDFKNKSEFKAANVTECNLFEVFGKQLHTSPNDCLCLVFNDDSYAPMLNLLPTVYGGSDGTKEIKCPDFLAIRVNNKIVACIATRLKPNFDTMTLRLITEDEVLGKIEKFIEFALSPGVAKPLGQVVSDA